MTAFKSSDDIMDKLEATYNDLQNDKVDPETARARTNVLKTVVKVAEIELDHAKMTGRLNQGSNELPSFVRTNTKVTKK